jgi:hypothetical protein
LIRAESAARSCRSSTNAALWRPLRSAVHPKVDERDKLFAALWSARVEAAWTRLLWGALLLIALNGQATPFVIAKTTDAELHQQLPPIPF